MRIGVVCSRLDLAGGGGMERLAHDAIEGLVDRGMAPVVITRKFDPRLPLAKRLGGVRVVNCRPIPGKLRDKYFSWRADKLKKRLGLDVLVSFHRTENADIVVCGGNHEGFLRAMGKRPSFFDRLHLGMEHRQYRVARTIVANSQLMRRELIEYYGVGPERIVVLYPAVDVGRFNPVDADERRRLRARFGFADERRVFLFPSGDHVRKGLAFLREFFETTDLPVELVVAGRDVRPGKNVRGFGFVKDIENLYRAVDGTVLASLYEPFGMVGVESACCGTPGIFTANMGCCEVAGEPAMFRIAPGNRDELERAVKRVVAFDRAAEPDLRKYIKYDVRKEYMADELIKLL